MSDLATAVDVIEPEDDAVKADTQAPRQTQRSNKHRVDTSRRFKPEHIEALLKKPEEPTEIRIPLHLMRDHKSGEDLCSLWIGSRPGDRTATAITVVRPTGSPKNPTDIVRVGARHDQTQAMGHARILVRPGDVIIACVKTFSATTMVSLVIDQFTHAGQEDRADAICEVIDVIRVDNFGEMKVYHHDVDNVYRKQISQQKLEQLMHQTKDNTVAPVSWEDHGVEHISRLPKHARAHAEFDRGNEKYDRIKPTDLFRYLQSRSVAFHVGSYELYHKEGKKRYPWFNHRTPFQVTYTVNQEDGETKVNMEIVFPYAKKILLSVDAYMFQILTKESALVLRKSTFEEFVDHLRKTMEEKDSDSVQLSFFIRL